MISRRHLLLLRGVLDGLQHLREAHVYVELDRLLHLLLRAAGANLDERAPRGRDLAQQHHLLFELSRHSDHHANAKRHFSILRSMPEAPQLPTGYPGMILLALVPPAFFAVMHPLLDDMVS